MLQAARVTICKAASRVPDTMHDLSYAQRMASCPFLDCQARRAVVKALGNTGHCHSNSSLEILETTARTLILRWLTIQRDRDQAIEVSQARSSVAIAMQAWCVRAALQSLPQQLHRHANRSCLFETSRHLYLLAEQLQAALPSKGPSHVSHMHLLNVFFIATQLITVLRSRQSEATHEYACT